MPKEILESVIEFENAEKLNPPMEKRKKQIITNDLKEKSIQIKKEIQIRDIPEIQANIKFVENQNNETDQLTVTGSMNLRPELDTKK